MGFSISSLFKPKAVTPEVSIAADPYKQTREKVLGLLDQQAGQNYKPYTEDLVAGMSDPEQQGQRILSDYLSSSDQPNATRQRAMDEINTIISSGGDPSKHPVYQAVKAEAARNQDALSRDIDSQFAGNHAFWSGSRVKAKSDLATDTANKLNTVLAQLGDQNQQRIMSYAIPQLLDEANRQDQLPLQKMAAANQYGQLPRAIQQALLDAQYAEFEKAQRQYPLQLLQLASQVQQAPLYAQQQFMPSTFSQGADLAAQFLPLFKKTPPKGG